MRPFRPLSRTSNVSKGEEGVKRLLNRKPGKNFSVFLVCLSIAVVFWFLNAFTKEYQTTLEFPIAYKNFPGEQILVSELPSEVKVEVSGFGFNLLTHMIFDSRDSLEVDYETSRVRRRGDRAVRVFDPIQLKELADLEIPGDIEIKDVVSDTIRMVFESEVSKQVIVAPKVEVALAEQYFISGKISVSPNKITITGPPSVLREVDTVYTVYKSFENLDKRLNLDIALDLPDNSRAGQKSVRINIPADQKTEGEITVPIRISGWNNKENLVLFPQEVKVRYYAGLSTFDKIDPDQFIYEVYASEAEEYKSYLILHQRQVPAGVVITNYEPHKVEFIIKK